MYPCLISLLHLLKSQNCSSPTLSLSVAKPRYPTLSGSSSSHSKNAGSPERPTAIWPSAKDIQKLRKLSSSSKEYLFIINFERFIFIFKFMNGDIIRLATRYICTGNLWPMILIPHITNCPHAQSTSLEACVVLVYSRIQAAIGF